MASNCLRYPCFQKSNVSGHVFQQRNSQHLFRPQTQKPDQQPQNHVCSITLDAQKVENVSIIHGYVMVNLTVQMVKMSLKMYVTKELVAHLSFLVKMESASRAISNVTVLINVGIILMKKTVAVSLFNPLLS